MSSKGKIKAFHGKTMAVFPKLSSFIFCSLLIAQAHSLIARRPSRFQYPLPGPAINPPYILPPVSIDPEIDPEPVASSERDQVIESFNVQTDIRYRFATTRMVSIIRNTAGKAREMTFDVTLPKEAFIVSFAMTIDDKVYDGEVKEKAEAKAQYDRAVQRGQSAGHIKQTPRHSNRFDVSVNVENGTAVNFTLTYQEILKRKWGIYEYEMHVNPGQAVEDFNVEVFILENRPLRFVKTPEIRKGSELTNEVEELNELTTVDRPSETTAHIRYQPDVSQQGPNGLAARFVVQYDVEHANKGDLLVVDGYFLHLFAPSAETKPLPKDIIFVLDVSGSMSGTKISQLKQAMKVILGDLRPQDRFNILPFSSGVRRWKRQLSPATSENIRKAYEFVKLMRAEGGTNINNALLNALEDLQARELTARVGMVFFLTDGDPTVGETSNVKISENVMSKNKDSAIFSLAFGQGADFESLKTISTQNAGFARKIYEASDAALQVESLYKEISAVSMINVSVEYLPGITSTTETDFPLVFNGSEVVICGPLLRKREDEFEIKFEAKLRGTQDSGEAEILLEIDDVNEVTIIEDTSLNPYFSIPRDYTGIIEKMWAFLTIKQMLREKQRVIENKAKVSELDNKILEMSLKYKFVTPLTSMVVTKPEVKENDTDKNKSVVPLLEGMVDDMSLVDLQSINWGKAPPGAVNSPMSPYLPTGLSVSRSQGLPGRSRHMKKFSNRRQRPSRRRDRNGPAVAQYDPNFVVKTAAPKTATAPPTTTPTTTTTTTTTAPPTTTTRKARRKKNKGKPFMNMLKGMVIKSNQKSLCLVTKGWSAGNYVLADDGKGFEVILATECLRKCRLIQPTNVTVKTDGQTYHVVLPTHPKQDWSLPLASADLLVGKKALKPKVDMVSLSQVDRWSLTVIRTLKRRKAFYQLLLEYPSNDAGMSGFIELVSKVGKGKGKLRPRKRAPKVCKDLSVPLAVNVFGRKARKFRQ